VELDPCAEVIEAAQGSKGVHCFHIKT